MTPHPSRFVVEPAERGERLDRVVGRRYPEVSRSTVRRWIDAGHVAVAGRPSTKAGRAVRDGERVEVDPPAPRDTGLRPHPMPLSILHRDDDLVVVDKPAGVVVHPGHGREEATLVHGLLALGVPLAPAGGTRRPGIVHRLDRETSGALVVACTDRAHRGLARAFADRSVRKDYAALVWGRPREAEGTIDRAIGRSGRDPTRMATRGVRGAARGAVTHYRTVEELPGFTRLDLRIETGRTHQIRVHLQSIHHPVVGDARYGGRPWRAIQDPVRRKALRSFDRLALHARRLEFRHPCSGARVRVDAPLPDDLTDLLDVLRSAP